MRALEARLVSGSEHYREVVLDKLAHARESVWIATANVKDMQVERNGKFTSVLGLFGDLAARGVELRLLHAELPSRPFRASFDKRRKLVQGGLDLKICPRVHFKAVLVDSAWLYLGSANLTGAGLGAKADGRRNFEVGIWTESSALIDAVLEQFNALWEGRQCSACRRKDVCPVPLEEPKLGRP